MIKIGGPTELIFEISTGFCSTFCKVILTNSCPPKTTKNLRETEEEVILRKGMEVQTSVEKGISLFEMGHGWEGRQRLLGVGVYGCPGHLCHP